MGLNARLITNEAIECEVRAAIVQSNSTVDWTALMDLNGFE